MYLKISCLVFSLLHGHRSAVLPRRALGLELELPHHVEDALPADGDVAASELPVDAAVPVPSLAPVEDLHDETPGRLALYLRI